MSTPATSRGVGLDDLLLAISLGANGPYDLDPIRVMKGAFLISQRGRPAWRELFNFQPYDYGPFDQSVYRARDQLVAAGYWEPHPRGRYDAYALTDEGRRRAGELELDAAGVDWLKRIGSYVTSRSFAQLLREIYQAYPNYAARSIANLA